MRRALLALCVALLLLAAPATAAPAPRYDPPPEFRVFFFNGEPILTWTTGATKELRADTQWLVLDAREIWRAEGEPVATVLTLPADWQPGEPLTLCRQWGAEPPSCHVASPWPRGAVFLPVVAR